MPPKDAKKRKNVAKLRKSMAKLEGLKKQQASVLKRFLAVKKETEGLLRSKQKET